MDLQAQRGRQVRLLHELSEPVQEIFFSCRTLKRVTRIPAKTARLRALLAKLDRPEKNLGGHGRNWPAVTDE